MWIVFPTSGAMWIVFLMSSFLIAKGASICDDI